LTVLASPITICSASNETYVLGLAVTLRSALTKLSDRKAIVYVLDGGIREKSWRRLEATVKRTRPQCDLFRLRPDLNRFAGFPTDWGSSVMAYARLILSEMVQHNRAIYIDSDAIVQTDLIELWNVDIGRSVMGATIDIVAKNLGNAQLPIAELGLSESAPCLNSGVLVMNLQRWRELAITAQSLSYLRRWPKHALNWDQSALNVVLYNNWFPLETTWNTPAWYADTAREGCMLDARILHFIGPHKPWIYGYHRSPSAMRFYTQLDYTEWAGWRPTRSRQMYKWMKFRMGKAFQTIRCRFLKR
jgi:lipopolysaccharide biosynthesis glycosyltransferase